MSDLPTDPLTELGQAAQQMHELYLTWIDAGFTESQALYLLAQVIRSAGRGTPDE